MEKTLELEQRVEQEPKKKESIWNKLFKKHKFQKPSKVAVLLLKNNGRAEGFDMETKKGFFEIGNRVYHEEKDCIFRMGKEAIPLAIIEEDSMLPYGTREWYASRPNENEIDYMKRKFAECQDHLLRGIRHAEFVKLGERDTNKMNGKAIIIWLIVGIVAFALLKGSGFV